MDDTRVYIEIPPEAVNYINRIIEGYDCLLYTSDAADE